MTTLPTHQITPQRPRPNIGRTLPPQPTALLLITIQCQHQGRVLLPDIRTRTITLTLLGKLPTLAIQPIPVRDHSPPQQGHPYLRLEHTLEYTLECILEHTQEHIIIHATLPRHRNLMDRRLQGLLTTVLIPPLAILWTRTVCPPIGTSIQLNRSQLGKAIAHQTELLRRRRCGRRPSILLGHIW